MVQILGWFLKRRDAIRLSWNPRVLEGEDLDAPADDEDMDSDDSSSVDEHGRNKSVHMRRTSEAMQSDFFWAWLQTAMVFVTFLQKIFTWTTGCVCHDHLWDSEMDAEWEKIARLCAMRGRRAAELVDGALTRFAQELLDVLFVEILALVAPLSQEDRNTILDEFDAGKIYILIELNIRSQLYESLPLKLLILGHLDFDKVRAGLIDCLLQYEALENPDVISQSILGHAGMRAEVLRFVVQQVHITECPGLRRFRLRALFLPTTEISIERKHAELHRWILAAPHHSPAFASLGVRRKEVTAIVDHPPELESLCEASINMRAPEDCLQVLGIVHHPDTQQYLREDGTFSSSVPDLYLDGSPLKTLHNKPL